MRRMVFGTALGLALLAVAGPVQAGYLYVNNSGSPACSDSNPGTDPAQPLCTIQKGVDIAQSDGEAGGDHILVSPGTYAEKVTISAATFSTSVKANGGVVTIKGSHTMSSWIQYSGNVYKSTGFNVSWTPRQVFKADNSRLTRRNDIADTDLANLPANSWKKVGTDLYVNVGGGNPGSLEVSRRSNGFQIATGASNVTLEGFTVDKTNEKGIYIQTTPNYLYRMVVTYSGHHGIHFTTSGGSWVYWGRVSYSANPNYGCVDGCTSVY